MIPRLFRGLCQDAYLGRAQCSTHRGNVSEQQLRPQLRTAKMPSRKRYRCQMVKGYKRRSKYTHKLPGKRLGLRCRGSRRHGFQRPQRTTPQPSPSRLPIRTYERRGVRCTLLLDTEIKTQREGRGKRESPLTSARLGSAILRRAFSWGF
jgi:hypothetical protein